jgi:hypothetical protein
MKKKFMNRQPRIFIIIPSGLEKTRETAFVDR